MEENKNSTKTTDYRKDARRSLKAFVRGVGQAPTSTKKPIDKKAAKTPDKALRSSDESKDGSLQLTSGLTTQAAGGALLAEFLDENLCRRWILERLHPGGPRCPGCDGVIQDETTLRNFWSGKRCICKACEKCFKAVSGTMLHGTGLSFRAVFLLAALIEIKAEGIDDRRIGELVGVSSNTVKLWTTRFRILTK